MSLAALWCFQRLTPETMTERLWRNANKGGKHHCVTHCSLICTSKKGKFTLFTARVILLLSFNYWLTLKPIKWIEKQMCFSNLSAAGVCFELDAHTTQRGFMKNCWEIAYHLSTSTYRSVSIPSKRTHSSGSWRCDLNSYLILRETDTLESSHRSGEDEKSVAPWRSSD